MVVEAQELLNCNRENAYMQFANSCDRLKLKARCHAFRDIIVRAVTDLSVSS